MADTTTLTLVNGVRVLVPDSLELMTPYVLQEQEDWFEDEIKFLRRLLQTGNQAIDIGANYGVYTLSMAKTVGSSGKVWAFEPASTTAGYLAQSIAINDFKHVTLERSALSKARGTARLSLNKDSELNSLNFEDTKTVNSEEVPLLSLDLCLHKYGWQDIDFVKIDAEGEEANILLGGREFFAQLSPLVQYEIKAGSELHMELLQTFANLGYQSYRLIPGMNLLVRYNPELVPDAFLLNLFCCKPSRAQELAARGLLVEFTEGTQSPAHQYQEVIDKAINQASYSWRQIQAQFPYGRMMLLNWEDTVANTDSQPLEQAIALYNFSQDSNIPPIERVMALAESLERLKKLCQSPPLHLRQASLARVALDFGAKMIAKKALRDLIDQIVENNQIDINEPFLAPGEAFDQQILTKTKLGYWVLGSAMEMYERSSYFSSFFSDDGSQERLEMIVNLGMGSPEIQRRISLIKQRLAAKDNGKT